MRKTIMRKTICALVLFALLSCRNEYDVLQQEKENSILEQSNKVFFFGIDRCPKSEKRN
jgi:hypothetical protein